MGGVLTRMVFGGSIGAALARLLTVGEVWPALVLGGAIVILLIPSPAADRN
jgi:hypothetical protein